MGFPKFIDGETMRNIRDMDSRVKTLEDHQPKCDERHAETDRKLGVSLQLQNSTDSTLKEILNEMKTFREHFMPSVVRSRDDYIAKDRIKVWAVWITSVAGAAAVIMSIIHFTPK